MPTPHHPATISIEQAARLIGVSRSTAYRARNAGHIPVILISGRLRVPVAKLYDLLGIPHDRQARPRDIDAG